jgi:predicted HTH domain antitoxin
MDVKQEQVSMAIELQALVAAGVYPNAETAIQEALRVLWQERPIVRIEVAVHRYQTEGLSIAKAAALAGVCFDRMKEILAERGVPLRLGPETMEEARAELSTLTQMRP